MKDAKRLFNIPSDFSSSEEQTGPESDFREPFGVPLPQNKSFRSCSLQTHREKLSSSKTEN